MANILGPYNPTFFAQEALMWLSARLGFAARVHRGYDNERRNFRKGDTVKIKRPTTFTAEDFVDGVGTNTQDLVGEEVNIKLTVDKEVKFGVTDKELAYTTEEIIEDHIGPAADAVANAIDTELYGLIPRVGPVANVNGAAGADEYFTIPQEVLFNNNCPIDDGNLHYLIDGSVRRTFQGDQLFHSADTTGEGLNRQTLLRGSLGTRFGTETFASQLARQVTPQATGTIGAAAGSGDQVGAVNGDTEANANTLVVDGLTNLETVSVGVDTITIAGDPTVYSITAVSGAVASTAVTLTLSPALRRNTADNAAVTFRQRETIEDGATGVINNLMFHRNAFAVAFAELPSTGNDKGAQISTVTDKQMGISLQARMWYDGDPGLTKVALRALFGVEVLDPMLAARVIRGA